MTLAACSSRPSLLSKRQLTRQLQLFHTSFELSDHFHRHHQFPHQSPGKKDSPPSPPPPRHTTHDTPKDTTTPGPNPSLSLEVARLAATHRIRTWRTVSCTCILLKARPAQLARAEVTIRRSSQASSINSACWLPSTSYSIPICQTPLTRPSPTFIRNNNHIHRQHGPDGICADLSHFRA